MEKISSSKRPVLGQDINGVRFPLFNFPVENIQSALRYKPDRDDTFIVTYPKSGSTWMQYIVWEIVHRGAKTPPNVDEMKLQEEPFIEWAGIGAVEKLAPPRYLTTHIPRKFIPYHKEAKYIYVARNPRDCCTSFFHFFHEAEMFFKCDLSFDDYFEHFMNGELPYGDQLLHVRDWYQHRNDPNMHFITYEEIKSNPATCIEKLAKFLGHHESLEKDPNLLQTLVERISFEYMKKNYVFRFPDVSGRSVNFFRKGIVGDWKTLMSEDQVARMNEKAEKIFANTELLDLWKSCV